MEFVVEGDPLSFTFGRDEVDSGLESLKGGVGIDLIEGEAAALHRRIIMR